MNETSTSDQRTSKQRRTCPDSGIVKPPSIPPTSAATHATSEETRYHPHEQSQQSSASCMPSSQLLMQKNSPQSFDYSVSSGGCEGTNTNSTTGMAMDHQSSSHLIPASSSRSNLMQGDNGSILSQCLQHDGQHKAPSKDGCEGYNPVATVQLLQNTPSKSFPTTAIGTQQLHGLGTGKSSLRLNNGSL